MNFYMGLDLSLSASGICVLDENLQIRTIGTIKTTLKGAERLTYLKESIRKTIIRSGELPTFAAIEGYSFGSFPGRERLGELGGVIRCLLFDYKIKYAEVAPLTLKKFITGRGAGDKNRVILEAYKRWGVDFADDNQVDAYGLARVLHCRFEESKRLKHEQEVIDKVFPAKVNIYDIL